MWKRSRGAVTTAAKSGYLGKDVAKIAGATCQSSGSYNYKFLTTVTTNVKSAEPVELEPTVESAVENDDDWDGGGMRSVLAQKYYDRKHYDKLTQDSFTVTPSYLSEPKTKVTLTPTFYATVKMTTKRHAKSKLEIFLESLKETREESEEYRFEEKEEEKEKKKEIDLGDVGKAGKKPELKRVREELNAAANDLIEPVLARYLDRFPEALRPKVREFLINRVYRRIGSLVLSNAGFPDEIYELAEIAGEITGYLDDTILEAVKKQLTGEQKEQIEGILDRLPDSIRDNIEHPITKYSERTLAKLVGQTVVTAASKILDLACMYLDYGWGADSNLEENPDASSTQD